MHPPPLYHVPGSYVNNYPHDYSVGTSSACVDGTTYFYQSNSGNQLNFTSNSPHAVNTNTPQHHNAVTSNDATSSSSLNQNISNSLPADGGSSSQDYGNSGRGRNFYRNKNSSNNNGDIRVAHNGSYSNNGNGRNRGGYHNNRGRGRGYSAHAEGPDAAYGAYSSNSNGYSRGNRRGGFNGDSYERRVQQRSQNSQNSTERRSRNNPGRYDDGARGLDNIVEPIQSMNLGYTDNSEEQRYGAGRGRGNKRQRGRGGYNTANHGDEETMQSYGSNRGSGNGRDRRNDEGTDYYDNRRGAHNNRGRGQPNREGNQPNRDRNQPNRDRNQSNRDRNQPNRAGAEEPLSNGPDSENLNSYPDSNSQNAERYPAPKKTKSNKFGRNIFNKNVSTEDDNKNQREEMTEQLTQGSYECMVCCDRIKQHQAIWSCKTCYHCFHIVCIKKWAASSRQEGG